MDAPLPGVLLDPTDAAKGGTRGQAPGHASRSRRPLSLGDRTAAPDGRGAGGSRPAGVGRRRDLAWLLPRAAPPRVRPVRSRADPGAPVRALRTGPRR